MHVRVLHHNQCFDGACSAALFAKFHTECVAPGSTYEFCGLQHKPNGGSLDEAIFAPGENAIVDFKFSRSPRLTWWFDHHVSAFVTPEDRAAFERGQHCDQANRQFFDPSFISCTGLIASIATTRFGFKTTGLDDLLYWADIIDGARFETVEMAAGMRAPAMQLAMVIENADDAELIPAIIPLLTAMPLPEVLAQPFVAERVAPLMARHHEMVELIRARAEYHEGTVVYDVMDQLTDGTNKFIPYLLYPEATYTVALSRSATRSKIGIGCNPWTKLGSADLVDISKLCERFGGGGHPRVGAVSFDPDAIEQTRTASAIIIEELRAAERHRLA